jgi:hypothetical protein
MKKPEILSSFGEALQQEILTLLENLGGMTDIIEANFSQIKDILQQNKQEVINTITTEKNKEISDLKSKIDALTKEKNKDIAKLEGGLKDLRSDLKAIINKYIVINI